MGAPIIRYGLKWPSGTPEVDIEIHMVRKGGQWKSKDKVYGDGLFEHFKRLETLLFKKVWHRWNEMQLREWLEHRTIGVIGPASSGKTHSAATDNLTDYYCWPDCTTILICSTTKERLEDRIWGEIKKYHKIAKSFWPHLPGNLIEGRLRLVTQGKDDCAEGRDFRNGIIGVPCKRGGDYVGLGDFIGIKNKRVRMVADELQLLPSAFVFSVSNLDKNPDLKVTGLGNPKETTDALGAFCEPAFNLGGWDGGIDQTPETKTWPTRRPDGICIQLVGTDSPNLDGKLGIPLITQDAINRDIEQYGKDSLQFTMMNMGMMPRGQGSRRVITRQLCIKNGAMSEPVWLDGNKTHIGFLDAAYKGVGGDRCVFGQIDIGYEPTGEIDNGVVWNVTNQNTSNVPKKQIITLVDLLVVPINVKIDVEPEDQIVRYVREQCEKRGILPENFFFDSGMRTSLVTTFGQVWTPMVNSIDCGGSPTGRPVSSSMTIIDPKTGNTRLKLCSEHYSKFITELWFSVRLSIESCQFRGLKESAMTEGCQREWKMVGKNRIEVEPKHIMKEKTGKSPDLFDAIAIGVEGARRRGFQISGYINTEKEEETAKPQSSWKRKLLERGKAVWSDGCLTYD